MRVPRSLAAGRAVSGRLPRRHRRVRTADHRCPAEVRARIASRADGGAAMKCHLWGLALGICIALPLGAQRSERVVVAGARGPNRLALDATLLAGAQPFHVSEVAASEGRVAVATGGAGGLRLFRGGGGGGSVILL